MCLEIPESQKKQPAKGLPPNWTFLFTRNKAYRKLGKRTYIPGLFIFHPNCQKTFRSIEAAAVYVPKLKTYNPNVVADFNRHIGVTPMDAAAASPRRTKVPKASKLPSSVSSKGKAAAGSSQDAIESPMTLEELFESACGVCFNCKKDNCGQCSSCLSNITFRRRQVCLQKVSPIDLLRFLFWFTLLTHLLPTMYS